MQYWRSIGTINITLINSLFYASLFVNHVIRYNVLVLIGETSEEQTEQIMDKLMEICGMADLDE